jgi:hypothetical protein
MPYDSVGDFLMRATPEEIKKGCDILKTIKPWDGKLRTLHDISGIPIKSKSATGSNKS